MDARLVMLFFHSAPLQAQKEMRSLGCVNILIDFQNPGNKVRHQTSFFKGIA